MSWMSWNIQNNSIRQPALLTDKLTTLNRALSVSWSVSRSVGPHFTFMAFLSFFISLPMPKWSSDLFYHCPYPPTCDRGSCVLGLVSLLVIVLNMMNDDREISCDFGSMHTVPQTNLLGSFLMSKIYLCISLTEEGTPINCQSLQWKR